MADLLTHDQALLDDIVGMLDLDAPLTPRVLRTCTGSPSQVTERDAATVTTSVSRTGSARTNNRDIQREKEKARQRRYRQRLKDSQADLQAQVVELTRQLEALTEEAERKKKKKKTSETVGNQLACAHWTHEASFERKLRLQSEAQQRQLVSAVNYQAEYIRSLLEMHNAQVKATACRGGGFQRPPISPTIYFMSGALYTTYMQQLEGCYARADTVMDASGLVSLPETSFDTVHRRKRDNSVAYFEHVNKAALPYGFQQTCDAMWRVVRERDEKAFGGCEVDPDDDVYIKSRVLEALNIGSVAQRSITRQYREEKRMVLVWKMSSEGEGGFRGVHSEETGWICVEPSPSGVVLSVCVQLVPMHFSSPNSSEPATKPFYNLLKESQEADKEEMTNMMATLLLDDALAGIEC